MSVYRLSRDGDREIEKGKRGIRDCPNEFEAWMEISGNIDEINKFCMGSGGSPYAEFNAPATLAVLPDEAEIAVHLF